MSDTPKANYLLQDPISGKIYQTSNIDNVSQIYQVLRGPDNDGNYVKTLTTCVFRSFIPDYDYGYIHGPDLFLKDGLISTFYANTDLGERPEKLTNKLRTLVKNDFAFVGRHFNNHMTTAILRLFKIATDEQWDPQTIKTLELMRECVYYRGMEGFDERLNNYLNYIMSFTEYKTEER